MKKLIAVITAALATAGAYAQTGQLSFNTDVAVDGPFVVDTGGVRLDNGFMAELWAGPDAGNLQRIAGSEQTFGIFNSQVNPAANGIITAQTTHTAGNVAAGANGVFQIRAWESNGGTVTSWQAAVDAGNLQYSLATDGVSGLVQFGGDPGGGNPFITPPFTELSTTLMLVPEPTTITLGLLGLGGLLASRRRKNA